MVNNNNKIRNLQVGDNDLVGNKFNGHDLHLYLREKGVDSSHLVWNKESEDKHTYLIAGEKVKRFELKKHNKEVKKQYSLDNIFGTDAYDILYNELFLNSDLVHYHLIHNLDFNIQMLPILTELKPTVWTLHDPWAIAGHCIHHFNCDRWEKGCGDCPLLKAMFPLNKDTSALNWEIKRLAIQNSQLDIIVASSWMEEQVKQSEFFKNSRIHLVPFGVNQEIFRPKDKKIIRKKLGIKENAIVLSARCSYSEFKGFDYIEYVARNIKSKSPIVFLFMGDPIEKGKYNFDYKEFGWIKDDLLLSEIYNASDLFLMPSKVDSFGMMAIESMSCGVLPIVLKGTALPEVVDAPKCGIATNRRYEDYSNTIQYFIDNINERELHAENCLKYARLNYQKEIYIERIINVYNEAISKHKKAVNSDLIINQLKKYSMVKARRFEAKPQQEVFKETIYNISIKEFLKIVLKKIFNKIKCQLEYLKKIVKK